MAVSSLARAAGPAIRSLRICSARRSAARSVRRRSRRRPRNRRPAFDARGGRANHHSAESRRRRPVRGRRGRRSAPEWKRSWSRNPPPRREEGRQWLVDRRHRRWRSPVGHGHRLGRLVAQGRRHFGHRPASVHRATDRHGRRGQAAGRNAADTEVASDGRRDNERDENGGRTGQADVRPRQAAASRVPARHRRQDQEVGRVHHRHDAKG